MENIGEFIQRLLEIQSGGRERSPELIAEDERLVEYLQERDIWQERSPQTSKLRQDSGPVLSPFNQTADLRNCEAGAPLLANDGQL